MPRFIPGPVLTFTTLSWVVVIFAVMVIAAHLVPRPRTPAPASVAEVTMIPGPIGAAGKSCHIFVRRDCVGIPGTTYSVGARNIGWDKIDCPRAAWVYIVGCDFSK